MKKYLIPLIFAALAAAGCLSLKNLVSYETGSWEGSGTGYGGVIRVLVETDAASIIDIKLLEQNEDAMIGLEAIYELKSFILETDSTDIDAVSGATQSSEGFLDAVNDALSKARSKK